MKPNIHHEEVSRHQAMGILFEWAAVIFGFGMWMDNLWAAIFMAGIAAIGCRVYLKLWPVQPRFGKDQ